MNYFLRRSSFLILYTVSLVTPVSFAIFLIGSSRFSLFTIAWYFIRSRGSLSSAAYFTGRPLWWPFFLAISIPYRYLHWISSRSFCAVQDRSCTIMLRISFCRFGSANSWFRISRFSTLRPISFRSSICTIWTIS